MERLWDVIVTDDLDSARVAECCRFLNRYFQPAFGRELLPAYFAWKLSGVNPAGPGFMTVAVHGDKVIGTLTGTRKRLWFDGREITACELGDGFTDPDYRRNCRARLPHESSDNPDAYVNKSIFGRLAAETTKRMLQAGCDFVYGTPNEFARPGWISKSGYVELTQQVTRSSHRFLRPPGYGKASIGGRLSYGLHAITHRATNPFFAHRLRTRGLAIRKKVPSELDLDDLWQRARPIGPTHATLVRDARYLYHRYLAVPDSTYDWFTVTSGEILRGAIVTRKVKRATGIKTLAVADWVFDRCCVQILPSVISEIIREGVSDVDTVSLWINRGNPGAGMLRLLGFPRGRRQSVIAFPNSFATGLIETRTPYETTLGSTDNI